MITTHQCTPRQRHQGTAVQVPLDARSMWRQRLRWFKGGHLFALNPASIFYQRSPHVTAFQKAAYCLGPVAHFVGAPPSHAAPSHTLSVRRPPVASASAPSRTSSVRRPPVRVACAFNNAQLCVCLFSVCLIQQRCGISTGLASSVSSSRTAAQAWSRKATQTRTASVLCALAGACSHLAAPQRSVTAA